jgi:hypothetical protein
MARPAKPIIWEIVQEMAIAGMNATNIARKFEIHVSNFLRQFKKEFEIDFRNYASEIRVDKAKCDDILWFQYRQAKKGNSRMLELLGREECGQGKEVVQTPSFDLVNNLERLLAIADNKIVNLEAKLANKPETE